MKTHLCFCAKLTLNYLTKGPEVLLENPIATQLVNSQDLRNTKVHCVFERDHRLSVAWFSWIQSTLSQPVSAIYWLQKISRVSLWSAANLMWLAQFDCAPQFFKTPKGLCGHTVYSSIILPSLTGPCKGSFYSSDISTETLYAFLFSMHAIYPAVIICLDCQPVCREEHDIRNSLLCSFIHPPLNLS
jgi:hypothetical protein